MQKILSLDVRTEPSGEFYRETLLAMEAAGFQLLMAFVGHDDCGGAYVFRYEYGNRELSDADWSKLRELLRQDDDGQPSATYQSYFGTLWHFVPFVS